VKLPKSGMGIEEATVGRWLKEEGEMVKKGEIIVEIETAKALEQLESPVSGRLVRIVVSSGQTTPVHSEIAVIEEE
jgi:pyruvate/2-oxoglutarate dehydrogenase complex dihydrolipoamide acyltransferase (E2) component